MKQAQPTFIEMLSSFTSRSSSSRPRRRTIRRCSCKTVGTGPWQLVEFTPGSQVKLKRYDGYTPNTKFERTTGFGGYKQACFDTVTFRIVTEPGARVAGLKTGELQGVEDLPTKSLRGSQERQERHAHAAAELVDPDRACRTSRRRRPTT